MADAPEIDVVVLGASAGGIEPLERVVAGLPPTFPAAVLVVVHVPPAALSVLPQILSRAGPLEARHAVDGEPLRGGRVYVAPPDRHLLIAGDRVALDRGPRENGHRPAVDALFRSAASAFGRRVAGVVLSGSLDDGAAGLATIKAGGGMAVVQDPGDAAFPGMPLHALDRVEADHVAPAAAIGGVLTSLAGKGTEDRAVAIGAGGHDGETVPATAVDPGLPPGARYSCPDCGGVLEPDRGDGVLRCRVGHAWAPQSLLAVQSGHLEEALWVALRTLEERAELAAALAAGAKGRNHMLSAQRFDQLARRSEELAQAVRGLLVAPSVAPAVETGAGEVEAEAG